MKTKVFILFFLVIIFSCNKITKNQVDFKQFKILLPSNWSYKILDGVDSYTGIINANGYKINFDYSNMGYANNLVQSKQEYIENHIEDLIPINFFSENYNENDKPNAPCKEKENIIKDYSGIKDSIEKYTLNIYKDSMGYYVKLHQSGIYKTMKIQFPCEIENHYFSIDTLKGFYRKIIYPKKTGDGITGLYMKDLNSDLDFQISAENLNKETQEEFLKTLGTLKLKNQ